MERSSPGWRLPLAIVLVVVNIGLVAANLNKQEIFPFNSSDDGVVSGDTTTPTVEETTDTSAAVEEDVVEEEPVEAGEIEDADDWPGGRGPVPEGPPVARRILIAPDGSAQITGSAPNWASAMQVASFVAANLGTDVSAVDNQLTWHPEGASDVQSGIVVIEQAATFTLGQSEIDPASLPTLDFVARLLNGRQSLFVVVIGHTDDVGDEQLNAELAFIRAGAVVDYLTGQGGVIPGQLVVASAGEDAPGQSNETVDGRRFNRRVELQFKNFLVAPGEIG